MERKVIYPKGIKIFLGGGNEKHGLYLVISMFDFMRLFIYFYIFYKDL